MPLTPGTTLGPYRVTAKIGEGGMGEVYRARDTKLDRDVALKVLPPAFTDDPDRLARFEREAKVLASLNHPNIGSIYGLEEAEGQKALVLELVEGPTLADRIKQGPIAVDEALPIAKQIAEALEAAHEAGVIHRDLKPANIKVREDGTVKVLDFGLAKALDTTPQGDPSESPTLTAAATQMGVIMGTAAYMSPEQASARRVDKRADIWAFGAVLWELLTGQQLFTGDTVSHVLAAVLRDEIEWSALPNGVPSTIRRMLHRSLERDPKRRLRDIGEARVAIDEARRDTNDDRSPSVDDETGDGSSIGRRLVLAVAALLVAASVGALATWSFTRPDTPVPNPVRRFSIVLPPAQRLQKPEIQRTRAVAISPSGSHIVYATNDRLFVRAMDEAEAVPLTGTETLGPASPFFSPDGAWVGFYSRRDRELVKIAVTGGVAVSVARVDPIRGATWGDDDMIVYGQGPGGVERIPADGGTSDLLVAVNEGEQARMPQVLPGGRAVLFTLAVGAGAMAWSTAQAVVQDLATGTRHVVAEPGIDARYLPTGHLLFEREQSLVVVPFDVDRLKSAGQPVVVVERVDRQNFTVADDGTLVFLRLPGEQQKRRLVWVDRDGRKEPIADEPRFYDALRISPDGTQVALVIREDESIQADIWVWTFASQTRSRLTADPAFDGIPTWTPDGDQIAFVSDRDGAADLFWKSADGTGVTERLIESPNDSPPWSFTLDGTRLVYGDFHPETGLDLHLLSLDGTEESEVLLASEGDQWKATLSPDGDWLTYQSNTAGQVEIYVRPFPSMDGRSLLSSAGGTHARWSPTRGEVYYKTSTGVLMAVPLQTEPSVEVGTATSLFDGLFMHYNSASDGYTYDVAPDGDRFLMIEEETSADSRADPLAGLDRLEVVLNWHQELLERVPIP